jgi:hypothetical protein
LIEEGGLDRAGTALLTQPIAVAANSEDIAVMGQTIEAPTERLEVSSMLLRS